MGRPSRDERRRDFLRTGAELATTPPDREAEVRALAQVTVTRVAEQTGMTRGSLYHLWPTQEAFRLDLMRSLRAAPAPVDGQVDQADVGSSVEAAVRHAVQDPAFRSTLSFLPYADSEAAKDVLLESESAMVDDVMSAIRSELTASHHRLRAEFSDQHLRSTVCALIQGMAAIALMHRGLDDEPDLDELVTATREAVDSVVAHFTESCR